MQLEKIAKINQNNPNWLIAEEIMVQPMQSSNNLIVIALISNLFILFSTGYSFTTTFNTTLFSVHIGVGIEFLNLMVPVHVEHITYYICILGHYIL